MHLNRDTVLTLLAPRYVLEQRLATYGPQARSGPACKIIQPAAPLQIAVIVWCAYTVGLLYSINLPSFRVPSYLKKKILHIFSVSFQH